MSLSISAVLIQLMSDTGASHHCSLCFYPKHIEVYTSVVSDWSEAAVRSEPSTTTTARDDASIETQRANRQQLFTVNYCKKYIYYNLFAVISFINISYNINFLKNLLCKSNYS